MTATPRGIHTTEFWLTVVAILCVTVLVALDKASIEIAIGVLASAGVYAGSRGLAKIGGVTRGTPAPRPVHPLGGPSVPVLIGALLIGGWVLSTGCASGGGGAAGATDTGKLNPRRVQAIVRLAAYVGTTADLRAHPEHRIAIEAAQRALEALVEEERWDIEAATKALLAAGLPELSGSEGQVAIVGGLMVFDAIGIGKWDAGESEHVRALIAGLEEGIRMAIEAPAMRSMSGRVSYEPELRSMAEATRTLPNLRSTTSRVPAYSY